MKLGQFGFGFVCGLGTGLILREVAPALREIAVPIAKVSLKTGIRIFERTREGVMRVGEMVEDVMAEVQVNLKEEKMTKSRVTKIRRKGRGGFKRGQEGEIAAGLREVA